MAEPLVRPGNRLAPPSWLDTKLLLGILLVLVAVVVGARVVSSSEDTTQLYVAAHPLVPGEHLTADDLSVGRVQLHGQGSYYVAADGDPPVGYVVQRYVGAGELLPRAAIAVSTGEATDRLVTLPVQPGHLPPDVGPGDLVDVYVTAKSAGGDASGAPQLVASDLAVQQRQGGESELSGESVLALVVAVPVKEVTAVVRADESGSVDVVLVPAGAAASATPAAGLAPSPAAAGTGSARPSSAGSPSP